MLPPLPLKLKLGMQIAFRPAVNILCGWFCVGKALMVPCRQHVVDVKLGCVKSQYPFFKTVPLCDTPVIRSKGKHFCPFKHHTLCDPN